MFYRQTVVGIVFFCTIGWVYSGSVIGADVPATAPARGLFDKPGDTTGRAVDESSKAVKVSSLGQIDLHVKEQDITKILQILSIQSQRNIIVSKNVTGTVTADLYGVDFYQALDAILQPNGFGFREKGNFIYVHTAAELKSLADADRKTEARVIRLNYLPAADASAFVTPLLSSAGAITLSSVAPQGFQPSISDGGANSFAHADTLIVRDYPENLEQISLVLKQLDVRPKQVLVEATVLQARLNESNILGTDVSILIDANLNNFVSPLNVVDAITNAKIVDAGGAAVATASPYSVLGNSASFQSGVGNTAQSGGFKFGFLSRNVSAFVRALDQVTDTVVLARPKVLVLNRQKTELLVGGKLGYVSTTQTQTSQTQTVEFLDVGTKLTLRPFIGEDNFVRLELKPSISDGTTRTVGALVIPDTTSQEMTTNIMVRNGQTVVLGGLFKEDTIITRRQVPGLGDIPLVGYAFRGQEDTVTRSEVIFLITPTVMKDEALYAAGERTKDSIELAKVGAREGLLPWSRTKVVSSYVAAARQQLEAGETDKALWSANLALYLDPTFVEARRIKEQLTRQRVVEPENSVLQDAVDQLIKKQLEMDAPKAPAASLAPESAIQDKYEGTGQAPATQPAAVSADAQSATPAPQAEAAVPVVVE